MADKKNKKVEKEVKENTEKKEVKENTEKKEVKENTEKKEEKEVKDSKKSMSAVAKASKNKEGEKKEKIELEREYIIPLRKAFLKVPRYRRAKKAVKAIKEFLAKHMKVEDRNLKNVKIDKYLNNEIWFRGIKKPPIKIKVKAVKKAGIVYAELADIPEKVKWDMERHNKFAGKVDKKEMKKVAKQEKQEKELKEERSRDEETKEDVEKEKASVEIKQKQQEKAAKNEKHSASAKKPAEQKKAEVNQRKALKR